MFVPILLGFVLMAALLFPRPSCASHPHPEVEPTKLNIKKSFVSLLSTMENGLRTNKIDEERLRLDFADILKEVRSNIERND
jgi:hypothetical protein